MFLLTNYIFLTLSPSIFMACTSISLSPCPVGAEYEIEIDGLYICKIVSNTNKFIMIQNE